MLLAPKGIKLVEDIYVLYGEKVGIRVCNDNCEYLTVVKQSFQGKTCFKLRVTNSHPFEKLDFEIDNLRRSHRIPSYSISSSNSGFYILNIVQLLSSDRYCEHEYVQCGDVIYLCTSINSELLIIGFDNELEEFIVSNLQKLLPMGSNKNLNLIKKSLINYEWIIDKVPISKEEFILEGMDLSTVPNVQTMKHSDTFCIRWRNNDNIIFANKINCERNLYLNSLSLGNLALSGRNGYWIMFSSRFNTSAFPNWYLLKKTLRNKLNNGSYSKNSSQLCLMELNFSENSQFKNLISNYFSNFKIPKLPIEMPNLISDPPIGWNLVNLNLTNSQESIENDKISKLFNISEPTPCIGGYIFDHAKIFNNDISITKNIYLKPLNSFSPKIQEQLLLEDILNCLMCIDGNYIKTIEHIRIFECSNNDLPKFASETLFIVTNSSSDSNLPRNSDLNSFFSVKQGLSEFSHHIINDPMNDKFSQDIIKDNAFLDNEILKNKYNKSIELRSEELDTRINRSDPMLYPLTYRILELSSLHRRIRQFLEKHDGISRFGVISETLCETFHELLKHFTIKISKFEIFIRKGQFSLQSLWSQSQQALNTLKVMDLIAIRVMYKTGCEIINEIFRIIQNNLQGDDSQLKIANFILLQLLTTWIKFFLVPWLKSGEINNLYSELSNFDVLNVDEKDRTNKILSNTQKLDKKVQRRLFVSIMLPEFLKETLNEVDYIGNINYLINNINLSDRMDEFIQIENTLACIRNPSLELNMEQVIQSLNMNSHVLKIDVIKEYINKIYIESKAAFYKFCYWRIDIKKYFRLFNDIFFCYNDAFIQEFIDSTGFFILGGNISVNCSYNIISQKWNELAIKYYENDVYCFEKDNFEFFCTFDDKILTESVFSGISKEENINFDKLYSENQNTFNNANKSNFKFEAFKHLTVGFSSMDNLKRVIWNKDTLIKYQIVFRLIFHLKYILSLLNSVWLVQQTIPLWNYLGSSKLKGNLTTKSNLNEKISTSYFLRQKMILIINGILEYILYDVIKPWNSNIFKEIEQICTLEDLIKKQELMLNEILSCCFFMEHGLFYSIYKLLSICHLFTRHSILFNMYGIKELKKFGTRSSMESEECSNKSEIVENENYINKSALDKFKSRKKGRFGINKAHVTRLINDSSFDIIMKKFESKFTQLLEEFFQSIFKCKSIRPSILNKLLLKLNYSGYYQILYRLPHYSIVGDQHILECEELSNEYLESD